MAVLRLQVDEALMLRLLHKAAEENAPNFERFIMSKLEELAPPSMSTPGPTPSDVVSDAEAGKKKR